MVRSARIFIRSVLLASFLITAQFAIARSAPSPLPPAPILAGVATDNVGHVYVADTNAERIYVLSRGLQLLAVWTVPRPAGPHPVHLMGVAIGRHHTVYAADLNDRIFELTPKGRVQAVWGTPGTGLGQFRQPEGIAVGAMDRLLVADHYNHRLQTFAPGGRFLSAWQLYSRQEFPGGPCGLEYLTTAPSGRVYVTDDCYGRVFKVSSAGKVLQIWGQKDHGPGQFSGIGGVAVGPSGNVFVAETFRILKFSPNGRLLGSIRKNGYPGYPFGPTGIAVDRRGIIYVADAENYRVFELSPSGQTLAIRCLRRAGCRGSYVSSSSPARRSIGARKPTTAYSHFTFSLSHSSGLRRFYRWRGGRK